MNSSRNNKMKSNFSESGSCWNDSREKLIGYLASTSTNLSNLYKAAVLLMYEYKIHGREWLICHAVREICNTLPRILEKKRGGVDYRGKLEYSEEVEKLKEEFDKCQFKQDDIALIEPGFEIEEKTTIENKKIEIPYTLFKSIYSLVAKHTEAAKRDESKTDILFDYYAPENIQFRDSILPCIEHYKRTRQWFIGKGHVPENEYNVDEVELERNFRVFESTLISLMGKFFDNLEDIDELLDKANK